MKMRLELTQELSETLISMRRQRTLRERVRVRPSW